MPDPAAAANWYEKYFGGRRITEAPDRLMFGSTRLLFIKKDDAKPSSGSSIDHIGFSFADLDAKMKEFQVAGVKIVTPMRDVPGLFKLGFVEDPWGAQIEVVEDPELLGLHHIHCGDRTRMRYSAWLLAKLGGERTKFKGKATPSSTARQDSATCGSWCRKATRNRAKAMPSTTSDGDRLAR